MFLPKWLQATLGGGIPLTLQSNRALRPSITSKTSKLRVKRGSREGMTLSLPHEVTSSKKWKKYLLSRKRVGSDKYTSSSFASYMWAISLTLTFSCAEFAHVCSAVIFMYRVKQQAALSSIKVHFTVEQCWLDQFPICKPVHIRVLWSNDVTLKQNSLSSLGCDVPDCPDNCQTWLHWWCWI